MKQNQKFVVFDEGLSIIVHNPGDYTWAAHHCLQYVEVFDEYVIKFILMLDEVNDTKSGHEFDEEKPVDVSLWCWCLEWAFVIECPSFIESCWDT